MNTVFDDFFDILYRNISSNSPFVSFRAQSQNNKLNYPVNLVEQENNLIYEIAAIGLDKEDIEVSLLENRTLTVKTKKDPADNPKLYHHKGIKNSDFNLQFTIPGRLDIDKMSLTLEKGLLCISIPKTEETKPKLLAIQ